MTNLANGGGGGSMITHVSFRNFKSLRAAELELERLTVLVGPNASGKTSVLEGIHYLSQIDSSRPWDFLSGNRHPLFLYSRGASGDMELRLQDTEGAVRLRVIPPQDFPDDLLHPSHPLEEPSWQFAWEGKESVEGEGGWKDLLVPQTARSLRSAVLLRLNASRLADATYSPSSKPHLAEDGQGLASALAYMALNQPDDFQELQRSLCSVIRAVKRVRFDRVPVPYAETEDVRIGEDRLTRYVRREIMGDALVFDMEGAPNIPAHLVSEGSLLVLGLLTVLLGPQRPNLVLLDNLDHGLHPKAQYELVALLRSIQEQKQDLQIIASTHSPYLLDRLKPEEVRLTTLREDGTTVCARLDEHPDFDKWKEEMTPGEFWSVVGEKWARDRNTAESRK